jgi:hypothetical protein
MMTKALTISDLFVVDMMPVQVAQDRLTRAA